MVYDPPYSTKNNRKSVHLLSTNNPEDNAKFAITTNSDYYNFRPKNVGTGAGDNKYLNPAQQNYTSYYSSDDKADGVADYFRGLVGLWKNNGSDNSDGTGSDWKLESTLCQAPVISFDETSRSFSITTGLYSGYKICYTTDGSNPIMSSKIYSNPIKISSTVTIKAVVTNNDRILSKIAEKTIFYNTSITLSSTSSVYDGTDKTPSVTVKDGTTTIESSQYNVTLKKGEEIVEECKDAGTYSIEVEDKEGENATDHVRPCSTTFTINKRGLTITADAKSKTYGDDDPALTYNSSGLVGTDAITGQLSRDAGENVGTYAINQNTLSASSNYTITYIPANLTINKKELIITADSETKVYDGTALTKNTYTNTALADGDAITSVTVTGSQTVVGGSDNVPSAAVIKKGDEDRTANYEITYVKGTLTVTKKALTIIADAKSKTYGEDDPALTYTSSGLIGSDAITGALSRDAGENAGTYSINQNTLTAGNNYAIAYTGANLTINKKDLTITADAKSKTYGDTDPTLTYTQEGLVSGDAITGTLSRDTGEDVGTYAINNTLTISTNYAITYVPANLTISQKEVGLDWSNTELVYNGTAQAPTATATGTVNDDAIAVTVTGTQTNAGEYTATASTLTGDKAGNYKLPIANTQTFTISPKSLGDGETAAEGITLDITTEGGNVVLNSVKDGEKTLVNNTDYTYDIQDEASDKIIAIAGIGNYTGSISGVYVCPVFTDPDGAGAGPSAAVYQARRDFASPTGVNAYIVRSVNPTIGTLTVSKLEYIPKDVPVLLLTESQASGFLAAEKDESTPAVSVGTVNSNLLKVAPTEGVPVKTAEVYMFYLGEFVLTQAGTVNAGRFYVHNPNFTATPEEPGNQGGSNSRRTLQFVIDDDVTGLLELKNSSIEELKTDVWYTLDGRRLSGKPTKGGIYILKGQKVIIKRK